MDKPPSPNPPEKVAPAESLKLRQTWEAQQKRNRDVGHMLKSGSFQQHRVKRSMPHVRGR
jgi:hypothetical protein